MKEERLQEGSDAAQQTDTQQGLPSVCLWVLDRPVTRYNTDSALTAR